MIRSSEFVLIMALAIGMGAMGILATQEKSARFGKRYEATWESITKHPNPVWFEDAKFGIYTHWGVYSVPAFGNEWYPRWMYLQGEQSGRNYYQYHKDNFGDPAKFGYKDFIPMFKAEKFNADEWAELFRRAGAKFAGPVAEHHDGFAMWDSKVTDWDAGQMGPKRDVVGELAKAIRARGMKFMVSFHHDRKWWYYETSYTPDHRHDTENPKYAGVGKIYPPPHEKGAPPTAEYMREWEAKVKEVIDKYQPDLLWFDVGLNSEEFFRSALPQFREHVKSMLAYYYNKAEEWGKKVVVTYKNKDLPEGAGILDIERGRMATLSKVKWLTDTSVDKRSWGYIKDPDYKSVNEIVDVLVDIVSKNGNLLLNIGPKPDGTIPQEQKDILLGIGKWLEVNGEAIYGTRAWITYGEGPTKLDESGPFSERREKPYTAKDVRFTRKGNALYAICLDWPGEQITIQSLARLENSKIRSVKMLGIDKELEWSLTKEGLTIKTPDKRPCNHAYTFKITLSS